MDVHKVLKSVHNLNDYVSVTQDVLQQESTKVHFNMSTVLSLKKIRSLEIELFNKCDEKGAAFVIFERMLLIPPSKTWGLLGKELILLIQYWLEAVRKHLIIHNSHWWMFLKPLLTFLKEIRLKDKSLPSILVQETAECLLDLANSSKPEVLQRYEILYCLNLFSAESSREVRLALQNKTEKYLTKLSQYMATCGHQPTQLAIMETLLRWLINRQHKNVREHAAAMWFPLPNYTLQAQEMFLSAHWMDFYQDARNFLNTHNENNDRVASVMCIKLTYGEHVIISDENKRSSWLDVNSENNSLSICVDSRSLSVLGVGGGIIETLTFYERDSVVLSSDSENIILTVRPTESPLLLPSFITLAKAIVKFTIAPEADVAKLDKALRTAFADKYQLLLDLNSLPVSTNRRSANNREMLHDNDVRFSHPSEVRRSKHSGYVVRGYQGDGWKSPSTVSTTSLAHLHEKLAALPRYPFDKERVSVCDQPQLSSVTEVSESDERSLNSTLKLRQFGVCERARTKDTRKFQSDGEEKFKIRNLSPVAKSSDVEISLLHVATIGSDESVINETIERLSKRDDFRNDNIVDLLLQEALEGSNPIDRYDRDDKKTPKTENQCSNDAIENTPYADEIKAKNKTRSNKKRTVTSNSTTTDESNTENLEIPMSFVNVRKKGLRRQFDKEEDNLNEAECTRNKQIDEKTIEDFFSRHYSENKNGVIVMSPTLAKKINESSSMSSNDLNNLIVNVDDNANVDQFEFHDFDVIECLNNMVDRVCKNFEKCAEYFSAQTDNEFLNEIANTVMNFKDGASEKGVSDSAGGSVMVEKEKNIRKTRQSKSSEKEIVKSKKVQRKTCGITLTYDSTAKKVKKQAPKKGKLKIDHAPKMSTILEVRNDDEEIDAEISSKAIAENKTIPSDCSTPLLRRKRKLYSPKDEDKITTEKQTVHISETEEDDIALSELKSNFTPKTSATCYKDIEKDRKKYFRKTRNRRSRTIPEPPSPKTKKMNDIFDHVKDKIESNEAIKTAEKTSKDIAIYNYSSDSEDSDFKQKKIELQKRTSTKTKKEAAPRRKGKTNTDRSNSIDSQQKAKPKRNTRKPAKPKAQKISIDVPSELIDERMRDAPAEELNTSLLVEKENTKITEEQNAIKPPEMEVISDSEQALIEKNTKKNRKAKLLSIKKEKGKPTERSILLDKDVDRTLSPLPGLVVETVPAILDDANESLNTNILEKFKKIYRDGPDEIVNTTQNLLSDIERIESPKFNVTDDLNCVNISDTASKSSVKGLSLKKNKKIEKPRAKSPILRTSDKPICLKSKNSNMDMYQITESPAFKPIKDHKILPKKNTEVTNQTAKPSRKQTKGKSISISTVGISPITAHGDFDEPPPDYTSLKEILPHRDLDIEYLNQSIKDHIQDLRRQAIDSHSSKSSDRSPVIKLSRISEGDIRNYLPSNKDSESYQNSVSSKVNIEQPFMGTQRRSIISPIKLFDDMCAPVKCDSIKSLSKANLNLKRLKSSENASQKIESVKTKSTVKESNTTRQRYNLRNYNASQKDDSETECRSVSSRSSRKRCLPRNEVVAKKRKLEIEDITISESGPSVSSVNEWFSRNTRASKEADKDSIQLSLGDIMNNIQEKLDTTLAEIHQNTTREYIKMFADAQRQLDEMKNERSNFYKQVTRELITNIVHLVDRTVTDMDIRARENENEFIRNLKSKACQLIRNDCKQKQAMVVLLKEDMQAVIDHMHKQ